MVYESLTDEVPVLEYLGWVDSLGLMVLLHYLFYMVLVLVAEPETVQSVGLHEPVGDHCHRLVPVQTISGLVGCSFCFSEGYT